MDPSFWGPGTWKLLHCVAEMYPENPDEECKKKHCQFLRLLGELLPCSVCQQHYLDMLKEAPPEPFLQSRETFRKWLNERHNQVNERLKKPKISVDQLKTILPQKQQNQVLMEMNNRNKTTLTMLYTSLGIGVFLVVMIIILAFVIASVRGKSKSK